MLPRQRSVSLVLGSGGARGLAHIGVIRWLEEEGYRIDAIAGCSIGALIGGLHAAGKLAAYEHWLVKQSRRGLLRLVDVTLPRTGLIAGDKVAELLRDLIGDVAIEALPIRFTAVATNIETGREVWLTRGPLLEAIRASIAIPVLFPPYRLNGGLLVDGGILNPVPIAPTLGDDTDLTIAIHVSGQVQLAPPEVEDLPLSTDSESGYLRRVVDSLRQRSAVPVSWQMLDIATQAFDAMQSTIARQKMAAYPPDVLVEIPRNLCRIHEFHRAAELIEVGYRAAAEIIPRELDRAGLRRRAPLGPSHPG
jgi:NTE family protein